MSWIYYTIAFIASAYCFDKSNVFYEEYGDMWWSFVWNITAIGIIISMFRL